VDPVPVTEPIPELTDTSTDLLVLPLLHVLCSPNDIEVAAVVVPDPVAAPPELAVEVEVVAVVAANSHSPPSPAAAVTTVYTGLHPVRAEQPSSQGYPR
jgi:hypothetical protein